MLQWVSSCLMIYLAAALADDDLLLHKNWHLLDQNGECGYGLPPPPSEGDADNEISYRILKGTDAIEHEFPWMAQLVSKLYKAGSVPICGGTLINRRYVLTAAHCVVGFRSTTNNRRTSNLFVRLGAHRVENDCNRGDACEDIQQVEAEEITVHAHYSIEPVLEFDDSISKNDIALVRLKNDVKFINGVTPVCLPADIEMVRPYFYGQTMVAAGFGQNSTVPEMKLPKVLQKATKIVLTPQECDMPIGWYGPRYQICVGGVSDQGVCRGDSGGPLVYWDERRNVRYQMGITSYIFRDCDANVHPFKQDAIYTRVAHYVPWILDHIRE